MCSQVNTYVEPSVGFNIHLALPEPDQSIPQRETGQKA